MRFSPYSHSRLSCFESCPKKFEHQYILKTPPSPQDDTALRKGSWIHEIFEKYPDIPDHCGDQQKATWEEIALKYINSPRGMEVFSKKSVNEYDFGLTEDFELCGYSEPSAMYRGSIDRVMTYEDGVWLLDYKTGKYKEQIWQSYEQLESYAVFAFIKWPQIQNVKITYEYVEHNLYNELIIHRDRFESIKGSLRSRIDQVESEVFFTKNITKLCDWCSFKYICEL